MQLTFFILIFAVGMGRGPVKSPSFYENSMINKDFVEKEVLKLLRPSMFLTGIKISNNGKISVFIDSYEGLKLKDCEMIHKQIYPVLAEIDDDFQLEVSSPGLTADLRVWQQFDKLKGKRIQIITVDNENFQAIIENADEKKVILTDDKNNKITLNYDQINKAKQIINF